MQVSTGNCVVVHAHGRLRIVNDEKFVRGIVGRLTRCHEAAEPEPWKKTLPREPLSQSRVTN